jgi:hypothetical protein
MIGIAESLILLVFVCLVLGLFTTGFILMCKPDVEYKLLWIFAAWFLPVFGPVCFFVWRRRQQTQPSPFHESL